MALAKDENQDRNYDNQENIRHLMLFSLVAILTHYKNAVY